MNKALAVALLIVGAVLLILGFNASGSVASQISEVATGTPSDRSLWLIALGLIGVVVGGFGVFANRSH